MADAEFQYQTVVERFRALKKEGIEDLPAAILVLADSVERGGTYADRSNRDADIDKRQHE